MNSRIKTVFFVAAVVIVLWLAFCAKLVWAGDAELSWTLPTGSETCTNDATVPDIAATQVWQLVKTTGPTDTSTTITGLLPGDYTFVASVVDTSGVVSRFSGTADKTIAPLIAVAGSQAFQPVMISNGWWMIPMATMDADTECDLTQNANGYYRVPPGSYTWLDGSTARPVMLVAECG